MSRNVTNRPRCMDIMIARWEIIFESASGGCWFLCHISGCWHSYRKLNRNSNSACRFWFARQCTFRRKSAFIFSSQSALRTTAYRQTRLQYETSGFCIINVWLELKFPPLLMILYQARWPYSHWDHLEFISYSTQGISITTKVESTH